MWKRIVTHDELIERIDALGRERRLIGPVAREAPGCHPPLRYFYEHVTRAAQLSLDFDYCVYGPKAFVLPPRETLFRFDRSAGTFVATPIMDAQPTALVGAHPCDLHGLRLLDAVFQNDRPDEQYRARRSALFVVGIDCARPCDARATCADWGTNRVVGGCDVMLYADPRNCGNNRRNAQYAVEFCSEAGRTWLGDAGRADDDAVAVSAGYHARKDAAFTRRLSASVEQLPALVRASYDSHIWEKHAARCYSCGSCNLVCPTCYCFDIQDDCDFNGAGGSRQREWDACMLPDFAVVAGGHNFRLLAAQRLRHRVMRKAAWIQQRTGLSACVGCGRCDRACTASISLIDMLNEAAQEAGNAHR
ncbi:MAG: 4Fe-4S dicluster domain-containing protein [Phycisphaerales bacterium]|nr:4Fe-4S dicluster domain-containing protein [Phycisphaerales bacterium]